MKHPAVLLLHLSENVNGSDSVVLIHVLKELSISVGIIAGSNLLLWFLVAGATLLFTFGLWVVLFAHLCNNYAVFMFVKVT